MKPLDWIKKDPLALLLLLGIISLFCSEILWSGLSPFRGDIPEQFYPWKTYVYESVMNGELPYWNPYTFGGAPLLANMQSGVFYPLDWALLLTFPIERFYGLSLWLHLCLAGLGTFFLAKKCGADSFPALFAATAYGLNGFTMIHIPAGNHLTYAAAAWAPWLLWATAGYVQSHTKKIKWALTGTAIAALHFLCGHPQMAFYSFFFSGLFCLVYSIHLHQRIESRPFVFTFFRILAWGFALLIGVGIAGFQLIPTLEYAELANRSVQLDIQSATEFSFAPHRLITLFFPEYYGTGISGNHYDSFVYWSCAYSGAITPLLALIAIVYRPRTGVVVPLALIALTGLLLAWGRGNPIYTLWLQLPGFGSFRAPAKYLPYYLTAVSVLAALGLERICALAYKQMIDHPPLNTPLQRYVFLAVGGAIVFVFGFQVFTEMTGYLRQMDGLTQASMIKLFSAATGMCLLLAGFTLYLLARSIPNYPRLAISASLIALLVMDLFVFGRGYLLSGNLSTPSQMKLARALPKEIGFLHSQEQDSPFRMATLEDVHAPNRSIHWKIHNLAGYDPMSLQTYNRLIGEVEGWQTGEYHDNIQLRTVDHPTLDLLNVKYLLTRRVIAAENLERVFSGEAFHVYERKKESVAWLWTGSSSDEHTLPHEWRQDDSIETIEVQPHRIRLQASVEQPTWIKLSEFYYPGWNVELRNRTVSHPLTHQPIHPTSEGLRAFYLPAGQWDITMRYVPPLWGWVLSFLSILTVAALFTLDRMLSTGAFYRLIQRAMGRDF